MRTIYKYDLEGPYGANLKLSLPSICKLVHFGIDPKDGELKAWFEVDSKAIRFSYDYEIVGTGWDILPNLNYKGTAITPDGFVWHLYGNFAS